MLICFIFLPAATSSEVKQRKVLSSSKSHSRSLATQRAFYNQNPLVKSDAAVAILSKNPDSKAALACALPWGHGWGWATLPNGVWSGGNFFSKIITCSCLRLTNDVSCSWLFDRFNMVPVRGYIHFARTANNALHQFD